MKPVVLQVKKVCAHCGKARPERDMIQLTFSVPAEDRHGNVTTRALTGWYCRLDECPHAAAARYKKERIVLEPEEKKDADHASD